MAKLNQIVAIEKGIKSKAVAEVSELYKVIQKPALFNGFQKTYQAKDEEGESLPAEKQRVQFTTNDVMNTLSKAMANLIDITARKDYTNCIAKADVAVDGVVIISRAPVSFLLFMEKQLTDLRTFVATLPILDEGEKWERDPNSGLFRSEEIKTHRTKKIQKPIVMYDATKEHPAQTQMSVEDVIAGYWTQVKHSGAIGKPKKDSLLKKIDALHNAIKQSREQANMEDEVTGGSPSIGQDLFAYLNKGA
jgi:hypothetical protein